MNPIQHQSQERTNFKSNIDLLTEFYRIWSTGDLSNLDSILAPDFIDHTSRLTHLIGVKPERVTEVKGTEPFQQHVTWARHALPDLHEEPISLLADGEFASGLYRLTGTDTGGFYDSAPTGKKFDFIGMDYFRVADGRFVEWWYSELGDDVMG